MKYRISDEGMKRIASKVGQFNDASLEQELDTAWGAKTELEMYMQRASESPNYSDFAQAAEKATFIASILRNLAGIVEEEGLPDQPSERV